MPGLGIARISRLAICIVLIVLGVTQPSWVEVHAAGEGWYSSWQLRKAITIDATKVSSGPHTNFPVLINLTSDVSLAARAQAGSLDNNAKKLFLGANGGSAENFINLMDEVRISNSQRAAGWITTEYNNQGTPTTFYSVGAATSPTANFFQLFE